MAKVMLDLGVKEIRDILFQLPSEDMLELAKEIEKKAQTFEMMRFAETGFAEWNKEEDVYGD